MTASNSCRGRSTRMSSLRVASSLNASLLVLPTTRFIARRSSGLTARCTCTKAWAKKGKGGWRHTVKQTSDATVWRRHGGGHACVAVTASVVGGAGVCVVVVKGGGASQNQLEGGHLTHTVATHPSPSPSPLTPHPHPHPCLLRAHVPVGLEMPGAVRATQQRVWDATCPAHLEAESATPRPPAELWFPWAQTRGLHHLQAQSLAAPPRSHPPPLRQVVGHPPARGRQT